MYRTLRTFFVGFFQKTFLYRLKAFLVIHIIKILQNGSVIFPQFWIPQLAYLKISNFELYSRGELRPIFWKKIRVFSQILKSTRKKCGIVKVNF